MPAWMDTALAMMAVLAAAVYLVWRKVRRAKQIARDWTTGRVEACDSCPVIEVRRKRRS